MASKRSYKRAPERRAEILRHALEAFADRGYHQTSVADICRRAGIGRATLYQYFADKRAVLVALTEGIANRVVAAVEAQETFAPARVGLELGDAALLEEQALVFLTDRLAEPLAALFEDEATTRLVLRAGRGADGVVDDTLREMDAVILTRMEANLQAAIDAGLIRPLDVTLVARFFLGGLEKVVLSAIDDDHPIDVRQIAAEAVRLEAFGIFPRTQPRD